jgi:hypothetical protein
MIAQLRTYQVDLNLSMIGEIIATRLLHPPVRVLLSWPAYFRVNPSIERRFLLLFHELLVNIASVDTVRHDPNLLSLTACSCTTRTRRGL